VRRAAFFCVAGMGVALAAVAADADFFAKNVYGEMPPETARIEFALLEKGEAFHGAAERRQYAVTATDARGAWTFETLVYLPKGARGPVPAFAYPNFSGNHTLSSDLAVRRCTGSVLEGEKADYAGRAARVPVEEIVARGYAFATWCYSSVYADLGQADGSTNSMWTIFASEATPAEKLAHPAWCWGARRVRDLLATLPEIAQDQVAIAGQSRMGKNAVVTGVNDPRFALVCANCGGTKRLAHLPNLLYPFWFSKNLRTWVRNDATGLPSAELARRARRQGLPPLPFEQEDYLALLAPRALVVSAATDDKWAPADESRAVFEAAKAKIVAAGGKAFWHLKKGPHSITAEDWAAFLDAADETFGRTPPKYAPPEILPLSALPDPFPQPSLPFLGTLETPNLKLQTSNPSNWRLGCETLDRDFADFAAYERYVGPLGIRVARLQGGWAKCEKKKGVYDFAWLDRIVDGLAAQGVEAAIETDYGNPIYPDGGGRDLAGGFPTGGEALKAWDAWVDALTHRFAGRVKIWMMWNEPDYCIGHEKTPQEIAAFNVRTAKIVKRNVPGAKLAGLSLATTQPNFFEHCIRAMGRDAELFDWFVYHGYEPAPETSYANVEKLKLRLAKYAPRARLWQGENGAPSEWTVHFALEGIPWTETSQAKWDMRRMLGDLGHDVASSVFTICDFNHLGREINRKGLLRADAWHRVTRVKRAYYAVRNVVAVFDGRWTRDTAFDFGDPTLSFYRYRDAEGRPLLVFWRHRKDPADPAFAVPGDSLDLETRDLSRTGDRFAEPVWIDLLSGRVHALETLAQAPVYDSPCVVTERAAVGFTARQSNLQPTHFK